MKEINFKQDGRFFFGWFVVLLGFLLMTFAYVGFVSLTSVFALPVTESLGFERGDWMTYMTLLSLTCVIASPILGKVMAKGNIKLWLVISCLCGVIGYVGFSMSNSLIMFYIFALILGIGFAGTAPMPVSILINNWFGGKIKGTATGIAFIGSGLGGMILSPILNAVIGVSGWRMGYVVLAAVYLVLLVPCCLIFGAKTPESKGFRRMGEVAEEVVESGAEKRGISLSDAKKTPELWLALASCVLVVFASSALLANSVGFFVECGIDMTKAASLHGFMLGSLILGKPVIGAFVDKVGIKTGAVVSTLIFALTFIVLFIMPLSPAVLVYGVILCYCLGGPSITVVPPLLINGMFGEKDYGVLVGMANMATSIGGAFGGMIAARIYDATGSYTSFWAVATIGVVAAALIRFICFVINKKRHTW